MIMTAVFMETNLDIVPFPLPIFGQTAAQWKQTGQENLPNVCRGGYGRFAVRPRNVSEARLAQHTAALKR